MGLCMSKMIRFFSFLQCILHFLNVHLIGVLNSSITEQFMFN